MRMTKQEKELFVGEISEKLKKAKSFIMSTYSGLSVEEITRLRDAIRKTGAKVQVIKNTLIKLALHNAGYDDAAKFLEGPIIYYFDDQNEINTIKEIRNFDKKAEKVKFIAGIVSGTLYDAEELRKLSEIPNRDELISSLLRYLNSPIYGLHNALRYNLSALVRSLNAIKDKKTNDLN